MSDRFDEIIRAVFGEPVCNCGWCKKTGRTYRVTEDSDRLGYYLKED